MATTDPKLTVKNIIENYIIANPITKDDGVTTATAVSIYERSPEALKYVFFTVDADVVITYGEPQVRSQREIQDVPVHFLMRYPVTITTTDKYSAGVRVVTAVNMQNTMRHVLRAAIAASAQSGTGATPAYELTIMEERAVNKRVGGLIMWETPYYIEYTSGGP